MEEYKLRLKEQIDDIKKGIDKQESQLQEMAALKQFGLGMIDLIMKLNADKVQLQTLKFNYDLLKERS